MGKEKLVSFDLKADFGFFKKPDLNDVYLTYNMLHKPALLGILGAIIGLKGFQANGTLPEYYMCFKDLKVGVAPLEERQVCFAKHFVGYNNSTGLASEEKGGILQVAEQILIQPEYRCFLLLDIEKEKEQELYVSLEECKAEFLPYMGKNDFSAWWENFKEYDYRKFQPNEPYSVATLFIKKEEEGGVRKQQVESFGFDALSSEPISFYFERLPLSYDEELCQYTYADFVYAKGVEFQESFVIDDLYQIQKDQEKMVIQLF